MSSVLGTCLCLYFCPVVFRRNCRICKTLFRENSVIPLLQRIPEIWRKNTLIYEGSCCIGIILSVLNYLESLALLLKAPVTVLNIHKPGIIFWERPDWMLLHNRLRVYNICQYTREIKLKTRDPACYIVNCNLIEETVYQDVLRTIYVSCTTWNILRKLEANVVKYV